MKEVGVNVRQVLRLEVDDPTFRQNVSVFVARLLGQIGIVGSGWHRAS